MEIKDQRRLAMWKVVLKHFNDNRAVWQGNTAVARAVDALAQAGAAADLAIRSQTGTTTGISEDKDALEATAISAVLDIAKSTRAFALETNNHTLFAAVNYSKGYLLHLPRNEVAAVLDSIVAAAEAHQRDLIDYGVDPNDYAVASGLIATYQRAVPNTRKSITDKKAVTDSVPTILKNGAMALTKLDNLVHVFERRTPDFAAQYKTARVIVDARGGGHERPADDPA